MLQSIRELSSPLTEKLLRPLDDGCKVVQFAEPLTEAELQRVAAFVEEYPSVTLRVYGHRTYSSLEFLKLLGKVRHLQLDLFELEDASGLRFLRPDLSYFGFGATRKKHSIAALERLTHVRDLWLEGHTKDFEVVSQLTSLQRLSLRSIRLPNLNALTSLRLLESLDLKLGGASDLSALPQVGRLRRFEAWLVRGLSDLTPIARVRTLRTLFLQALKGVSELPGFSALTELARVHLETMKSLTDLAPLASAPSLEQLLLIDMRHLSPDSLRPLVGHPKLRGVTIGLGSKRKNDAARAVLGLPPSPPETFPELVAPAT